MGGIFGDCNCFWFNYYVGVEIGVHLGNWNNLEEEFVLFVSEQEKVEEQLTINLLYLGDDDEVISLFHILFHFSNHEQRS